MYIIFGWEHKTTKNYCGIIQTKCGNCGQKSTLTLKIERKWFTLYFIPLIPYHSEYKLICDTCSFEEGISGKNVSKLKKIRKATKMLMDNEITSNEYQALLDQAEIRTEEISPSNDWECPKCKGKNPNIIYACKHCGYRII